jgi:ABC-type nickel/cobalt efflux system permease component RcnA
VRCPRLWRRVVTMAMTVAMAAGISVTVAMTVGVSVTVRGGATLPYARNDVSPMSSRPAQLPAPASY